jgi:hypothetical protein
MEFHFTGAAPALVLGLGILFSAGCLKLGARLSGVRAGLGKAVLAVVVLYPAGLFVTMIATMAAGPGLGFGLGLLTVLAVLKTFFGSTWTQACVMWVLMMLAQFIAFVISAALLGFGLMELFKNLQPMMPAGGYEVGLPLGPALARFLPPAAA